VSDEVHTLNLVLKFLYVVPADQALWNSTQNHLLPTYFPWSLSHFCLLNPISPIPCPIFPYINPIASFRSSSDRSVTALELHLEPSDVTVPNTQLPSEYTRQNYTFCKQQETHTQSHSIPCYKDICVCFKQSETKFA